MQPEEPKHISNSIINKLIAKLHGIKKSHSKVSIVDLLEPTKYFKKLIYDKEQRRQFLEEASPYLKLKFFPKGTVINEYKTDDVKFSIIVEGKVALYTPRTSEEIWNDHRNQHLPQVIEYYVKYIKQRKAIEKNMKAQQTKSDVPRGKKKITKMMTLSKIKEMAIQTAQAQPAKEGSLVDIVTSVLDHKESILPDFLLEYDLTAEEKLLLLPHYNNLQDIVKNGRLIFKHTGCIVSGDMFGETSLLRPIIASNTMVAHEDVYLAHLTRSDFEKIYLTEGIVNVKEKLQFLEKMFPSLGDESRIKLACFLEERMFSLREVLFREGTEADEIYMIKSGEVELLFYDKNNVKNKSNNSPTPRSNPYEKAGNTKINISKLQSGSIFGEEEVVQGTNRKYSAIIHQTNTFLYVLKKEIYSIFSEAYPDIANAFQDWITVKKKWRDNKIQKELEEEDDSSFGSEEKSLIKHKRQARLSIFKTDPDEPIHERLRKKQSIIKIQASVGFKAPYKSNAEYDITACASPHFQEKRISTLDLQNLNLFGLVSPVSQKAKPFTFPKKNTTNAPLENLSIPAIKILSPIIKPKDEIELQKSNLFLYNQKLLNGKFKACKTSRNEKNFSIKLAPIVKRSPSQVDFKSSLNQIPETLTEMPDLKKNLQLKLYGGLSTRLPKEESPSISLQNSPNMKPIRIKKGLKPISLAQGQTLTSSIANLDTEADFKPYHFSSILVSPVHQRSTTLFNILDSKSSDTSNTDTQNSPSNSKITQSWNTKPRSVFFVK